MDRRRVRIRRPEHEIAPTSDTTGIRYTTRQILFHDEEV
jgi:hypothetical protein